MLSRYGRRHTDAPQLDAQHDYLEERIYLLGDLVVAYIGQGLGGIFFSGPSTRHGATAPSSGAAKLAAIRKMLKIHPLDPNWTLPSRLEDNPMVWMLNVNGFMMEVRHAPREVQEIAFNKGLIPYIPADRQQGE